MVDASSARRECGLVSTNVLILRSESVVRQLESRARDIQLKIAENSPDLEALMWAAYLGLESYMELREPFKAVKYFMDNGGKAAIAPKPPLKMPPNATPQLVQAAWNQAAQNARIPRRRACVGRFYRRTHTRN